MVPIYRGPDGGLAALLSMVKAKMVTIMVTIMKILDGKGRTEPKLIKPK